MSKYFKNFILCGEVDYHCLLCNETYSNAEDVEKHIRWEKHRKNIKGQALFTKFKQDSIYKIGARFYCEVCNYLASNMTEITNHVKDEEHKSKKNNKDVINIPEKVKCKRDSGYVIVSNLIVEKAQWNAIANKRCLLCDINIGPYTEHHIMTSEHIVKLIQAKVVFENDECYRKITPDLIYCFICKKTASVKPHASHWDDQEHIDNKATSIAKTSHSGDSPLSSRPMSKKDEYMKRLIEIQKQMFKIDVMKQEAVCIECKEVVKFRGDEMMSHQEAHLKANASPVKKQTPKKLKEGCVTEAEDGTKDSEDKVTFNEIPDHGKRRSEMAQYGRENFIKLNAGGSKGYCSLCNIYLSGHIRLFKEHVGGKQHEGHLNLKGLKAPKRRELPLYEYNSLKGFLKTIHYANTLYVFWLNQSLCVDIHSFILVSPVINKLNDRKTKCFACDVEYDTGHDREHITNAQHKKNFLEAVVITTLSTEFVREIRPNLFHCAYCNRVFAYWENLKKHLRSIKHFEMKADKMMAAELTSAWYRNNVLTKVSSNPDVMYLQLISLGIFS